MSRSYFISTCCQSNNYRPPVVFKWCCLFMTYCTEWPLIVNDGVCILYSHWPNILDRKFKIVNFTNYQDVVGLSLCIVCCCVGHKIETTLGIVCGLSEQTVCIAHCVPSNQTPLLIEPVSSLLNPKGWGWGWGCTGEGKIFPSFKHSVMESEWTSGSTLRKF